MRGRQGRGAPAPECCRGNFDGNGTADYAFTLRRRSGGGRALLLLHRGTGGGVLLRGLPYLPDGGETLWLVRDPGPVDRIHGEGSPVLAHDGIAVIRLETSGTCFAGTANGTISSGIGLVDRFTGIA